MLYSRRINSILAMRLGYKKKCLCCVSFFMVLLLLIFMHPDLNERSSYSVLDTKSILSNLCEDTLRNLTSTALTDCDYYDIVKDETTLSINLLDGDINDDHKIKEGGEYAPSECRPKFSTAVIVPYREGAEQLRGFLVYMHMFLRRQQIHYRIYVVEQVDSKAFNRAKLMNIGAITAMRAGYPCLVLHDVDLLPLRPSNLYACTKLPRHMSANINKFRFALPYLNPFGGAISISSKQFQTVNGMSNDYYGWGGENDDLYARLETHHIKLCKFEPKTSLYHISSYQHQKKSENRNKPLEFSKERMVSDGISSLRYTEVATVLHPLFTHIMVDL